MLTPHSSRGSSANTDPARSRSSAYPLLLLAMLPDPDEGPEDERAGQPRGTQPLPDQRAVAARLVSRVGQLLVGHLGERLGLDLDQGCAELVHGARESQLLQRVGMSRGSHDAPPERMSIRL